MKREQMGGELYHRGCFKTHTRRFTINFVYMKPGAAAREARLSGELREVKEMLEALLRKE